MPEHYEEPASDDQSTFDVDAWLTEAKPPQRAVVVYGRGDLLSRLQELDATPEPPGQVMGGSVRLKEMVRIREQIEASRRVIHVRALLDEERNEIIARNTKPSDDGEGEIDPVAYENEAYALALVDPVMTVAQVAKLRAAIGAAQWTEIGTAITKASVETIPIPLSRLGSGSTQDS